MFRYRLPWQCHFFRSASLVSHPSHFHSCFQAAKYLFPRPFFFFSSSMSHLFLHGRNKAQWQILFFLIMIPFFTVRRCRTRGRFNQPNTRRSIMLNGTREFFSFAFPLSHVFPGENQREC